MNIENYAPQNKNKRGDEMRKKMMKERQKFLNLFTFFVSCLEGTKFIYSKDRQGKIFFFSLMS